MVTALGKAHRKIWSSEGEKRKLRGRPWARLRAKILKRDQMMCQCEKCKGKRLVAHEVDHIKPLSQGGTDDEWNLRAMNRECHLTKSKREANANFVERPAIGVDGWPIEDDGNGSQ